MDKNMFFIVIFLCLFLIMLSYYIIYKTDLIFQNTEAEFEDYEILKRYKRNEKETHSEEVKNKKIDENLDNLMDGMNSIK